MATAIYDMVEKALEGLRLKLAYSSSHKAILEIIPCTEIDEIRLVMYTTENPDHPTQTLLNISTSNLELVNQCCMKHLCPIMRVTPQFEETFEAMCFIF